MSLMVVNPLSDSSTTSLTPVPTGRYKVSASGDRPSPTSQQPPTSQPLRESSSPLELSLVIPTYQEAKNIAPLIQQLTALLDPVLQGDYELIVVDDDSPDRTWEQAQTTMEQYPQVRVMRRTEERGLSTAVIRGWQAARGSILGVIDADLQHPPETLIKLLSEVRRGADLAVASRHVVGGGVSDWSLARRVLSRGAQMLGLLMLPEVIGRVSDPMSGYFLVRREAIANVPLSPVGYKILIEVLGRGKVRWIGECGYVFQERQEGDSKVSRQHYWDYLLHLWRLRWSRWQGGRLLRFGIVGLSGVFVDMAVFYGLRGVLGWGLTRSAILSAEVAIFNNFLWNDRWTFGDISRSQTRFRQKLKRFLKFNVVCLLGLLLNVTIINILFNRFGVNEYAAKLLAIAAVTLWNFWFNLKLSWRVTEKD
ncbi:MAG: glycosyltransferase [Cyanobacteria bacterium P01_D01_bin.73]